MCMCICMCVCMCVAMHELKTIHQTLWWTNVKAFVWNDIEGVIIHSNTYIVRYIPYHIHTYYTNIYNIYSFTYPCTSIYTRILKNSYTCTLIYSYTHILIHSYTHTFIYSYTHTLIHSYTHTFIHSYTHTLIHSYTHTYAHHSIQMYRP